MCEKERSEEISENRHECGVAELSRAELESLANKILELYRPAFEELAK